MKIFPSDRLEESALPESETCFFILKLPAYGTRDKMRRSLLEAIQGCSEINF
jgi:hypothetical protein